MVPAKYIPVLQKLGSYGDPDYDIDNQEEALKGVNKNRKDVKSVLSEMFKNTNSVEKHQTKTMSKALPGKKDKETGNPLLKVAMQSPHYRAVTKIALRDEIEKIAISSAADQFMKDRPNQFIQPNRAISNSLAASKVSEARAGGFGSAVKPSAALGAARAVPAKSIGSTIGNVGRQSYKALSHAHI